MTRAVSGRPSQQAQALQRHPGFLRGRSACRRSPLFRRARQIQHRLHHKPMSWAPMAALISNPRAPRAHTVLCFGAPSHSHSPSCFSSAVWACCFQSGVCQAARVVPRRPPTCPAGPSGALGPDQAVMQPAPRNPCTRSTAAPKQTIPRTEVSLAMGTAGLLNFSELRQKLLRASPLSTLARRIVRNSTW